MIRIGRLRKIWQKAEKKAAADAVKADEALYSQLLDRNREKSYADFVSENYGNAALEAEEKAVSEAVRSYDTDAVGYGRRGEMMAKAGLRDSGYAAYLTREREKALSLAKEGAKRERREIESEAKRSYGEYLKKYEKGQESRMQSAVKMLLNDNFTDGEDAYRYALALGLSGERAEMLRDMSTAYGADGYRDAGLSDRIEMLRYITGRHMDYEQAYRYALALGAPEETAERIAHYAESAADPIGDFLGGSR